MSYCGGDRHPKTIDILTDNVLLEIFDLYRSTHSDTLWEWHLLVHVCRRWRQIIFQSPHRLDLKIRCTSTTPVRENLCIWPAFPIAIDFFIKASTETIPDDAIAAFEHTDRVGYVKLDLKELPFGPLATLLATVTSKPFPVLTHLLIHVRDGFGPLLYDSFLGGSAPRLQMIHLRGITFPALQTLLLSASDLVELQLRRIPPTGYILPVAMAMCLADLPKLKTLVLRFQLIDFTTFPIHPPPVTRTVLPALSSFEFRGTSQYLEDFVAHIDCPRLNQITIYYLIHGAELQVEQLTKFFNDSLGSEIFPFRHAKVCFDARGVTFDLYGPTNHIGWDSHSATTVISCRRIDWHLFRMLNKFSAILSSVVDLKFMGKLASHLLSDGHNLEWLHYLRQLSALQTLYVSPPLAEQIGHALKSVKGEVAAEAFPSLDLICLEGQAPSIEELVAFRQLSDCPLTVASTEAEFDQRLGEK